MADDPFDALGLGADASADEVRRARRRLAKRHHPDRGGDPAEMRALNAAAARALARLAGPPLTDRRDDAPEAGRSEPATGVTVDMPSFTVEALPVETFEALLVVATWLGEMLDDDPPYRLDAHLGAPLSCWCRLDLVPEAGATTVSVTIGAVGGHPLPEIEVVRDVWVDGLNHLDWDGSGPRAPRRRDG